MRGAELPKASVRTVWWHRGFSCLRTAGMPLPASAYSDRRWNDRTLLAAAVPRQSIDEQISLCRCSCWCPEALGEWSRRRFVLFPVRLSRRRLSFAGPQGSAVLDGSRQESFSRSSACLESGVRDSMASKSDANTVCIYVDILGTIYYLDKFFT